PRDAGSPFGTPKRNDHRRGAPVARNRLRHQQAGRQTRGAGPRTPGGSMTTGKTAVLGLGIIGSRAATRLLEAGNTAAWNRTPKGFPGEVSGVEEAVTGADLVCLYLKDALAVREVADRCLGAMSPGS